MQGYTLAITASNYYFMINEKTGKRSFSKAKIASFFYRGKDYDMSFPFDTVPQGKKIMYFEELPTLEYFEKNHPELLI